MSHFDCFIVGHGLAGAVLAHQLQQNGFSFLVIDRFDSGSSSQVAAGLVNPITGRRVVKSWMADTLIPFAENFYSEFENQSDGSFYHKMDLLEIVHSTKDLNEWLSRTADNEMKKYLSPDAPVELYMDKLNEFKKIFRINSSGWMNIPAFIEINRKELRENNSLLELKIDYDSIRIESENIFFGDVSADQIIFCEGVHALQNPFWKWIPLVPAKGEILTIECRDLPEDFMLSSGIFLIPLGDHLFRTGSTFEWNFENANPTEAGKQKLTDQLKRFLRVPFNIIDHRAGIRPTVKDRRPIIGRHPKHKNILIFNGLGTKGVQLAPFFANRFVEYLQGRADLMKEIDANRFLMINN